jgi:uncharacterized OB-fold protein
MARSEHIDASHKQMDMMQQYSLEEIQKRQQLWTYNCEECGKLFNTQVKFAKFCGTCSTVANVLWVWGLVLAQRWNIVSAKPHPLVERIMTTQQPPNYRRMVKNG